METGQMTCALQVDTQTPGWHKTLTKVLKSIGGLAFTIDAPQGIAWVSGNIDPGKLLLLLAKAGKHAEIVWVDSGSHPTCTASNVQGNVHKLNGISAGAPPLAISNYGYYGQYPYHQYGYDPHYHMFSQYQLPYYDVYTPPTTPYPCLYPSYTYYEQPALYFPQARPPLPNQRLESFCNMM